MAQRIQARMIDYKINGGKVAGYEARPGGAGRFPGVVVIIEWWGLDSHIKDVTERFAREGYYALAPDIYHGTVTADPQEAMKLTRALDRERAVKELVAAVDHIKGQRVSNGKVGVIGYCMGGGLALLTAVNSEKVDAVNPYYGGNPNPLDLVQRIQCPILGLYAGHDEANRPSVPALEGALRQYRKQFECIVYPDAPHAFFNDTQDSYRKEAAEDAWRRTQTFFGKHLKGS
ncbi:MAG: dienelactone hydrolase family protein [Chloroflexi bacterium]|nr:dienelactone hydrolase family protein [Chloroflexota bacterium]